MAQFSIEVSYAQVAVFYPRLPTPFNQWTDAHVAQGFCWRPGSVSFGTLESAGELTVEVIRAHPFDEAASESERIIMVPFSVPLHGSVEIGSIGESAVTSIPQGEYELIFEHGWDSERRMWATLHFRQAESLVVPRVIRADTELRPPAVLLMTAKPA
jgi:hypothetical protein